MYKLYTLTLTDNSDEYHEARCYWFDEEPTKEQVQRIKDVLWDDIVNDCHENDISTYDELHFSDFEEETLNELEVDLIGLDVY